MNAEGGGSRYDGTTAKTYNVGATASWELDIFGKLTAAKRGTVAALQGSRDYQQAVQTQLVATIADSYYTLVVLDAQRTINNRTLENWRATVRTLEALKKVGKANEAGVLQAKANVMQLESSQLAICKSISETENALSAILAMPSHSIERSNLVEASFLIPSLSEFLCSCLPTVPMCVRLKWDWHKRFTPPMQPAQPSTPISLFRVHWVGLTMEAE